MLHSVDIEISFSAGNMGRDRFPWQQSIMQQTGMSIACYQWKDVERIRSADTGVSKQSNLHEKKQKLYYTNKIYTFVATIFVLPIFVTDFLSVVVEFENMEGGKELGGGIKS